MMQGSPTSPATQGMGLGVKKRMPGMMGGFMNSLTPGFGGGPLKQPPMGMPQKPAVAAQGPGPVPATAAGAQQALQEHNAANPPMNPVVQNAGAGAMPMPMSAPAASPAVPPMKTAGYLGSLAVYLAQKASQRVSYQPQEHLKQSVDAVLTTCPAMLAVVRGLPNVTSQTKQASSPDLPAVNARQTRSFAPISLIGMTIVKPEADFTTYGGSLNSRILTLGKQAAQDNAFPQRSSVGEAGGLSFECRDEDHAKGRSAWGSTDRYLRSNAQHAKAPFKSKRRVKKAIFPAEDNCGESDDKCPKCDANPCCCHSDIGAALGKMAAVSKRR